MNSLIVAAETAPNGRCVAASQCLSTRLLESGCRTTAGTTTDHMPVTQILSQRCVQIRPDPNPDCSSRQSASCSTGRASKALVVVCNLTILAHSFPQNLSNLVRAQNPTFAPFTPGVRSSKATAGAFSCYLIGAL